MCLSKKGVPFSWDDQAQHLFDNIKCVLLSALLLIPPDFNRYFLLYLTTSESEALGMVLVQEDDMCNEHPIYYLSKGLVSLELCYSHIEKLDFVVVIVVQ